MERQIGEIFKENGIKLIVIKDNDCNSCDVCYFKNLDCGSRFDLECRKNYRQDQTGVIFVKKN